MTETPRISQITRRTMLRLAHGGVTTVAALGVARIACAREDELLARLGLQGSGKDRDGRIRLDLPRAYEDGRSVPFAVDVDCPMSASDHVKRVSVMAPGNPFPEVATFCFTPFGGKASVATRIRLDAGDQPVIVAAEFSDGSVEVTRANVQVTHGGCSE